MSRLNCQCKTHSGKNCFPIVLLFYAGHTLATNIHIAILSKNVCCLLSRLAWKVVNITFGPVYLILKLTSLNRTRQSAYSFYYSRQAKSDAFLEFFYLLFSLKKETCFNCSSSMLRL